MAKLQLYHSLKVATALLKKLLRINFQKDIADSFVIETVYNCREQGFLLRCIADYDWGVSFAECRNSDSIVVYVGLHKYNGIPTTEIYQNATFFDPKDLNGAVGFIADAIIKKHASCDTCQCYEDVCKCNPEIEIHTRVLDKL